MSRPTRRIAIACQGGGSHTAFTAGVLGRLLQPDVLARHNVVGLSGTSGGAICALLAWAALVEDEPARARELLAAFWSANSASSPGERVLNQLMLLGSRLADAVAVPALSPYDNVAAQWSSSVLRRMLEDTVDLDRVNAAARARSDAPLLLLGAVEVLSGQFKTFTSSADEISVDAVLASAAIPTLFRSVQVGSGVYWDGLFSQNPPVTQLISSLPDEIWVVQINPTRIEREPKTVSEIANRRNELAGNLSLYQELGFIEHLDHFLETGAVSAGAAQPVTVRVLEMDRPASSTRWGYASKLNRDPDFITELIDLGVAQTETFLTALGFEQAWLSGEAEQVLAYCDEGTTVCARGRVAHCEPTDDPGRVRAFIRDRLADTLRVERSRKRICRGRVSWEIRQDGTADRAHAVARFEDGMLRDLRIDDEPDWSPL